MSRCSRENLRDVALKWRFSMLHLERHQVSKSESESLRRAFGEHVLQNFLRRIAGRRCYEILVSRLFNQPPFSGGSRNSTMPQLDLPSSLPRNISEGQLMNFVGQVSWIIMFFFFTPIKVRRPLDELTYRS